jgi:tetratricopeptide (TPR) repeat protein
MLVSHLRFTTESHWWRCFWPNRVFAALLCLGLLMVVCDRMSARFLSSYWEAQARLHPKGSDTWLDGLSRAAQAQPERFDLPFEVGEWLLARGRQFQVGHEQDLETSLAWFDRSMQAWPSYPYAYLMKGHALDSLRRSEEAESYYKVAASLDPRSSQVMAYWGLHEIEMGQLEAAHEKFETSWDLRWYGNHLARDYLRILKQRLDLPPLTNPETGEIIH